MTVSLIRMVWSHFILNLVLQVLDGVVTYQVVSQGLPEANPLVRNLIMEWGVVWGLLYWKTLACLLLVVIFALRHRRELLTIKAFTVTESVYSFVSFLGLYALFLQFSG